MYAPKNETAQKLIKDPDGTKKLYAQVGYNTTALAEEVGLSRTSLRRVLSALETIPEVLVYKNESPNEILVKENTTLRRENQRQRAINQVIKETIESACIRQKPIKVSYPKKHSGKIDEEIAILVISDTHIGAKVTNAETGKLEEYSFAIFKDRVETYKQRLHRIINEILRVAYPINDAIVLILGDLAEGEDVFRNQAFRLDMLGMEQIFDGGRELAGLLSYISSMFRRVWVKCVPGNHGVPKGPVTIDYDMLIYHFLASSLRDQTNLEFHISESPFHAFYLDGENGRRWNFLMLHGGGIQSYNSTPFYGIEKKVSKMIGISKIVYDYTFLGHHHTDAMMGNAIINGAWIGANEYSLSKMTAANRPTQRIHGFHKGRGLTFSYPIHLEDERKFEEVEGARMYTPIVMGK